ncbi:hypothetical protein [Burkholderia pseudomallei]|nr:hypothetical protein [Burkholderia pseudomallei]NVH67163.1 hypothetical protein [Burkholderia pseudomallei]
MKKAPSIKTAVGMYAPYDFFELKKQKAQGFGASLDEVRRLTAKGSMAGC